VGVAPRRRRSSSWSTSRSRRASRRRSSWRPPWRLLHQPHLRDRSRPAHRPPLPLLPPPGGSGDTGR